MGTMQPVSLSLIEERIIARVKKYSPKGGDGALLSEFDVRRGLDNVNATPALGVALEDIGFEDALDGDWTWSPKFGIYLVFKSVAGEAARRLGSYPICEGVLRILIGSDLGLEIDRLKPLPATEVVHQSLEERSLIAFKLVFETSFDVSEMPDDDQGVRLLRSGLQYFRQDPDDNVLDESDVLNVNS